MKGFITFEGCEGVGKSTQIRMLREYFEQNKINAVFTREPGGVPICENIRSIILNKDFSEMSPICETLLYASSRAQLVSEVIKPNLDMGITDGLNKASVAAATLKTQLEAATNVNTGKLDLGNFISTLS